MKGKKARQNGFAMIFVIVVLALVGIYMFVLTGNTKTILFQTNLAYIEACEQNLIASGRAWAKENAAAEIPAPKTIDLDTSAMGISKSHLSISITPTDNSHTLINVTTQCTRRRHNLTTTEKYKLQDHP